jgi:N-carbamoylputrescine amidase
MSELKVAVAQWPDGLRPGDMTWKKIAAEVAAQAPDVLVTNEMPFGHWLAEAESYDPDLAQASVSLHEEGMGALAELRVPVVFSSRPVSGGLVLANEAFALVEGRYRSLHQKHYFPQEPGFYEQAWFELQVPGFQAVEVAGLKIGVLLCTELMFNRHALDYGRAGVQLIIAPRASGTDHRYWEVACAMAAIVSGAYLVTANRTAVAPRGQAFGGRGMVFSPQGIELAPVVAGGDLILCYELNLAASEAAKMAYPCYVDIPPTLKAQGH